MAARLIATTLLGLAAASSAIVLAQFGEKPAAAVSGSAGAPVKYESAFSGYKPFRDQELRSWKEANQQVAENPMDHGGGAMNRKAGSPGHDMSTMKDAPGKAGNPRHDMGAMKAPARKGTLARVDPKAAAGRMPSSPVTGTGIVQAIDKTHARVRLTHDPIAALGWPKLTLFFRLKDRSLAEQVKEGERVKFLAGEFGLRLRAPGEPATQISKGLYPRPSDLARVVGAWTPAEQFVIIRHGLKMTGMPAWGPTHSDEQIWEIVAFLGLFPTMPAAEYREAVAFYETKTPGTTGDMPARHH